MQNGRYGKLWPASARRRMTASASVVHLEKPADPRRQLLQLVWLGDEGKHLRLLTDRRLAVAGGEEDGGAPIARADRLGELHPIHPPRHDDVREDHVEPLPPLQPVQRFLGTMNLDRGVAMILKRRYRQLRDKKIILHHQHLSLARRRLGDGRSHLRQKAQAKRLSLRLSRCSP
jgi:hypothetical protein